MRRLLTAAVACFALGFVGVYEQARCGVGTDRPSCQ